MSSRRSISSSSVLSSRGVQASGLSPAIGLTALLEISDVLAVRGVRALALLEPVNPGGAIEDRPPARVPESTA